ncbi:MAG: aminotransferase class IV [Burkholderiales bacterium]
MIYYFNDEYIHNNVNIINIADRGFLLGDGVFTTLKAVQGKLIHLDKHIKRLNEHASLIGLFLVLDSAVIGEVCKNLLQQNSLEGETAVIRITVTRGISDRGIKIPPQELQKPTLLIKAMPYHDTLNSAVKLCTTLVVRNEKSMLSQIKSLNYLESIIARNEADMKNYDDGIMFNSKGYITECSTSNIFFLTLSQEMITPPITDGVLPGIVRGEVISICKQLGIKIREESFSLTEIEENFIAGFITNSAIGIREIELVNHKPFLLSTAIIKELITNYNYSINACG